MIAYVKDIYGWIEESDNIKILNSKDVVFGETVDDIVNALNHSEEYNEFGNDFILFEEQYTSGISIGTPKKPFYKICRLDTPMLRTGISFERAFKYIKKASPNRIRLENSNMISDWEKELGKSIIEVGIIESGCSSVTYNPIEAKKYYNKIVRYNKRIEKYINIEAYDIRLVTYAFSRLILKSISSNVDIRYFTRTKISECNLFMDFKKALDKIYGKNFHRKVPKFQTFKEKWKDKKPKSAKSIKVTEEFFDFMQNEIKYRKPKSDLPV